MKLIKSLQSPFLPLSGVQIRSPRFMKKLLQQKSRPNLFQLTKLLTGSQVVCQWILGHTSMMRPPKLGSSLTVVA